MNTYYQILATLDGKPEILFGSFDKSDCTSTLDCDKAGWKAEGFRAFRIIATETPTSPDAEIYGEWVTGKPQLAIAAIYKQHVEENGMTCNGEKITSEIHGITSDNMGATVTVNFEDEYMGEVIAGNVACSIYDAIETDLAALGYEITDSDGSILYLARIAPAQ